MCISASALHRGRQAVLLDHRGDRRVRTRPNVRAPDGRTGRRPGARPNRRAKAETGPASGNARPADVEETGDDANASTPSSRSPRSSASPALPSIDTCPGRPPHPDFHRRSVGPRSAYFGAGVASGVLGRIGSSWSSDERPTVVAAPNAHDRIEAVLPSQRALSSPKPCSGREGMIMFDTVRVPGPRPDSGCCPRFGLGPALGCRSK